ncbi:putative RNA helicase SDE3 [Prunus yedoensis var. nudiflora]|uniref:Putative RNA helicase SDE3 n=1 Tax=Prunus yedoensis var. nudiflora TaxID=2094558 RepID=A0A314XWM1_PRUYE|nr:putative RNA helicase SDE3 [Prunus yedoensis var. nudiflora]
MLLKKVAKRSSVVGSLKLNKAGDSDWRAGMSIFLEVLKCLLCCEDEHENYHDSYNQIPRQTSFHHDDYEYQTPHRNYSPPRTSTNQSPAFYNYKPPSPPSQAPKSPFSSSSSSPEPPTSSSKPRQSSSPASSFTLEFLAFASKLQLSSSVDQPSALPKPPTSSSKLPQSTLISPSSPSLHLQTPSSRPSPPKLSTSSSKPPQASSKSHSSSPKPPTSSKPSPSSGPPVSSSKLPPIFKQVLSPACPSVINQKVNTNYVWVEKDPLPIFVIPEDIKDLIKNDIVPNVLNQPLSPTTYKDYFAALLYAEEFYHEKWADFNMKNVTLKLHEAAVYKNLEKEEKTFIEFEIDSVPENRPFLLSRDLVYVRPSGTNVDQFQGIIYRIIRSHLVLVEFEDEFYAYHDSTQKYDVSFSFNRVCLKRAHQAVQTASDALLKNFLFPDCVSRMSIPTAPALLSTHPDKLSAVRHILSIQGGSPPYLVAGSTTRGVVSEAVRQLCQTSPENKVLICAPSNRCCDGIMRSLLKVIPESDMFRANAAFREKDEVPDDILPSCLYKEPYFSCPPKEELREFRVIFSTYMSSFRLHDKGLTAGHFSHIFLVDASSAIEPETAVALTNFAEKSTTVIVTGQPGDNSRWVRADMARQKGLKISYFERLFKSRPYRSLNPMLITHLDQ